MIMSLLGSIAAVIKGPGLSECIELTYLENAVVHILSGKAVSRALRAHLLMQSALVLKIINLVMRDNRLKEDDLIAINAFYQSFVNPIWAGGGGGFRQEGGFS